MAKLVSAGTNHATLDSDPTPHDVIVTIRDVCHRRGDLILEVATMYASCESAEVGFETVRRYLQDQ